MTEVPAIHRQDWVGLCPFLITQELGGPCPPRTPILLDPSQGREQGAQTVTHLKGTSLKQGDLVVLRKITEARDVLGKLYHLSHRGREAHGEVLPDLLHSSPAASMRVHVHGTCLEKGRI